MVSVHVITPARGDVRPELALFRESLAANDRRYTLMMNYSDGQPVANNRNQIAKRFLERGGDYLLMIDSDVCPLFNPLDYVEKDLDVVGFPTPTWRGSHDEPLIWNPMEPGPGGLVEAEWVSTACILIARRVLTAPLMRSPFLDVFDADGLRVQGEDEFFCWRARESDFTVWCDTSRMCSHFRVLDLATLWRYVHGRKANS